MTSGLSGSSVLTGLIARSGRWVGANTVKKHDYDTYENAGLVTLNKALLDELGYTGKYEMEFRQDLIDHVAALGTSMDASPYRGFLATCDQHRPWIWKDPRLWLTMRFWHRLMDWDQCTVIVLTRGLVHS
jgi:hypothetical protein